MGKSKRFLCIAWAVLVFSLFFKACTLIGGIATPCTGTVLEIGERNSNVIMSDKYNDRHVVVEYGYENSMFRSVTVMGTLHVKEGDSVTLFVGSDGGIIDFGVIIMLSFICLALCAGIIYGGVEKICAKTAYR